MPYTPEQHRLFEGVAHGSFKKKGLSKDKAAELASEGVKKSDKKKKPHEVMYK